jgi:hypothetical protein
MQQVSLTLEVKHRGRVALLRRVGRYTSKYPLNFPQRRFRPMYESPTIPSEQSLNTTHCMRAILIEIGQLRDQSSYVGSQSVLAHDLEFSCAASLTFVSWNGSAGGSF